MGTESSFKGIEQDVIMENHLSLIKSDFQQTEKRTLPRFPYSYLTFKAENGIERAFAVKNISFSGMQLGLKDGGHPYRVGEEIKGELHWKGVKLAIVAEVKWVHGQRLGIEYKQDKGLETEIKEFLSVKNIIQGMRALHKNQIDFEIPADLHFWLQADGPFEVFVWCHNDGEISRFQFIMMDSFVEYHDGKGLKSGRVVMNRDLDTPLVTEEQFIFEMDEMLDGGRLDFARSIVTQIPDSFLPTHILKFLHLKLSV